MPMQQDKIIVDVGSSTVKVYRIENDVITPLVQRRIHFKDGCDPEGGVSPQAKKELFEILETLQDQHKHTSVKLYATGIFRKLTSTACIRLVDEIFARTGQFFNIISHDLESFYLEMALVGKYIQNEPMLLINIGGGSSEVVVMHGREAVERHNIDIGVGIINSEFSGINDYHASVAMIDVVNFVKAKLPVLSNNPRIAMYNGGELTYMRLADYVLEPNTFFHDEEHPQRISVNNMRSRNEHVFSGLSLQGLEALIPHDPKWMHGARGCSAIAQAICEAYGIEWIIPSDSNMVHGIVRQEFRHVTLSGSFRKHLDYILEKKSHLERHGTRVLSPRFTEPKNPGETFVVFGGEEGLSPLELERHHLDSIAQSDALIVCDPSGYVGASAMFEIGYAHSLGKRIIFTEKPEEFMLNTIPAETSW